MSLYSKYLLEKEGKFTLETEQGFITFALYPDNKEVFIDIVYVVPEKRKEGIALQLEKEVLKIAKEAGCTMATGVVMVRHQNATQSLKVMLAAGYKIHSTDSEKIVIMKSIEGV